MENKTDTGADTAKKPKITNKRSKKTLETNATKATTSKTTAKPKTRSPAVTKTTSKSAKTKVVGKIPSDDIRRQMIATAAYYRAESRGFCGGNPVDDWLIAETEIDSQLSARQ